VQWKAHAQTEPTEQSIHKARGISLAGFKNPIIEIFGITHRGNGNLYLYELEGQQLLLLLETRAVDFNADLLQFRNGTLTADYMDLDGDGISDLILTGVIEEWDDKGTLLVGSRPCRQVFLWNVESRAFREDVSRREGFSGYFD
jgi:hypothetical protein